MKGQHTFLGIWITVILCLFSFHLTSQNRQYIDVWGGLGYSSLYHGIEGAKVPGGFGYELGVGYEFDLNQVMFIGGLEFMHLNSKTSLLNFSESATYTYKPENVQLDYLYQFDRYNEKHSIGYLNVPLQVGYRFNDRFFLLAGAKVGLNLFGSYKQDATLDVKIADPQLAGILENVGHGTGSLPVDGKEKLSLGLNVAPTVEFGMYLDEWIGGRMVRGRRVGPSYRVSVFADYGLMNLNKSATENAFVPKPSNPETSIDQMTVNGLLASDKAAGKRFGNLFVGLKFAVLFQLPQKTPPPPSKSDFYARVINAETKESIVDAEVTMNMTVGKKEQVFKERTDMNGVVGHPELRHTRYQISSVADGYANYKKFIRHSKLDTILIPMNPIPVITIHVVDAETNQNLGAEVAMSSTAIGSTPIFKDRTDPATGMYSYQTKGGRYQISANAEGYFFKQDTISYTKTDTFKLALQPIPKKQPIVLHNLFFEFGTANMLPESEPAMDELATLLMNNPELNIVITGHTDNVGAHDYNMKLSKQRAQAVYDKLIEKGIDPARLSYTGKGDTDPVDTNETDEGRQNNRRVDFTILGEDAEEE